MNFRSGLLAITFVACILAFAIPSRGQEQPKSDRWEYATLSLQASTTLTGNSKGWNANKREIRIEFDAQDTPKNSVVSYYQPYPIDGAFQHEKFNRQIPSFFYHIQNFYNKFTGKEIPERYKDSQSEVPLLDAVGELGWELATITVDREEDPGKSVRLVRKFYFKRPKK